MKGFQDHETVSGGSESGGTVEEGYQKVTK